jgi:hypothetical protein
MRQEIGGKGRLWRKASTQHFDLRHHARVTRPHVSGEDHVIALTALGGTAAARSDPRSERSPT